MKSSAPRHLVVLAPGFFGFKQIGQLAYFRHVDGPLAQKLRLRGIEPETFVASPDPTGTFDARARLLLDQVHARFRSGRFERVHFVGHSMGAMDFRLALDPDHRLPGSRNDRRVVMQQRAVLRAALGARVSIAAPHWGTPLAVPFVLIGWGALQRRLPFIARLVLSAVKRGVAADELFGTFLAELAGLPVQEIERWARQIKLLGLTIGDIQKVLEFVLSVAVDRRAIGDLTPRASSRRNARQKELGADTPHCFSILARAPRPDPAHLAAGPGELVTAPTYLIYAVLWLLTAYFPTPGHFAQLSRGTLDRLQVPWAGRPDERDNDGMVPTLSQPWGQVAALVEADHEDVIGHFAWVTSGATFREDKLHAMLDIIADCMEKAG